MKLITLVKVIECNKLLCSKTIYSKTCLKRPLKKKQNKLVFNTDYRLMQVKSIGAFCKTLACIKVPFLFCLFLSGRLTQAILYL